MRPSSIRVLRPLLAIVVVAGTLPLLVLGADRTAGAAPGDPVDWGDLSTAGLTDIGDADPTTPLTFYLGFARDRAALTAMVRSVSEPSSPDYGDRTPVQELSRELGAGQSARDAVVGLFAGLGLTATVDPTGTYAQVTMTLAQAESLFSADWRLFQITSGVFAGMNQLYPTTTPVLPAALAGVIDRVHGAVVVDRGGVEPPTSSPVSSTASATSSPATITGGGGTANRTGTPSGCAAGTAGFVEDGVTLGLTPSQYLQAYGIDDLHALGLRGEGTRVAVVDDSTYEPGWLETFRACFGLSDATPITPHLIGSPGTSEAGETILDLSVLSTVAPAVDRFDVFMVDLSPSPDIIDFPGGMIGMFTSPLDATQTGGEAPDVISASFGACEGLGFDFRGKTAAVSIMEDVLATAAAAGITYVVSTGDSGSSGCLHQFGGEPALLAYPELTVASVEYPSSSKFVTAVGGTNLTLDAANDIVSTGVWNDRTYGIDELYAGTGGTSTMVERPWYQDRIGDWGPTSPTGRTVPDVASFADTFPGYLIVGPTPTTPAPVPDPGFWQPVGGTSAATPLTAGMVLLLDQLATRTSQPRLGFLNPLLYQLGRAGSSSLLDITIGDDDVASVGCCSATAGYDLATGWGSPLANRLAAVLLPPTVEVPGHRVAPATRVQVVADVSPQEGTVLSYAWDIDADGTTDQVTTQPSIEVTAPELGAEVVSVEITTSLGRTAHASGVVVAVAPARLSLAG
jgi:subtilase family serine protease